MAELPIYPPPAQPAHEWSSSRVDIPRTNVLAVLSLVAGILGWGIVPIVLGYLARNQIRQTRETGWGLTTAGILLGFASVVGFLIVLFNLIPLISSLLFQSSF
jgi:hypothetical protein